MEIRRVCAAYFSGTGTTKKVVTQIAETIWAKLKENGQESTCVHIDFSLPQTRQEPMRFAKTDLVIFGTPVYAGRVPNVLLKYLETIEGGGAIAVPVVLYGNRNYDDALIELRDILEKSGCHTVAAGAFIGEHSFSTILGAGRPDEADMALVRDFAEKVADKAVRISDGNTPAPIATEGIPHPYRGYYQPRDRKGNSIDIRKVKPVTGEACGNCGICAKICPMGSIDKDNVKELTGICIKCCACIKQCPKKAKYFEDTGYLYHQHELEEEYTRRAEPQVFL